MKERKKIKFDICNSKFAQKAHLNQHVATVHEGKKQFRCEFCNKYFGERKTLNKHVESAVHKKTVKLLQIELK